MAVQVTWTWPQASVTIGVQNGQAFINGGLRCAGLNTGWFPVFEHEDGSYSGTARYTDYKSSPPKEYMNALCVFSFGPSCDLVITDVSTGTVLYVAPEYIRTIPARR